MSTETLTDMPSQTFNQGAVIDAEKVHIGKPGSDDLSGIAVSGGGIRSAAFGLGVMQALVNKNQLQKMDYLSTVSGGGYLGSALTWALKQGGKEAGTTPDKFPLGKKGVHRVKEASMLKMGADSAKTADAGAVDSLDYENNQLLDYIRQHSNYLTPTSSLDIVSFAVVVIRSMVMSLFVYFTFITIAMTIGLWSTYKLSTHVIPYSFFEWVESFLPWINITQKSEGLLLLFSLIMVVAIVVKGFLYSLTTFYTPEKFTVSRYINFIKGQKTIGWLMKLSMTFFIFGSLPYMKSWLGGLYTYAAGGSTLFGTLVGLWQYKKSHLNEKNSGISSSLLIYAGAFFLFYGILHFSYHLATLFFLEELTFNFIHLPWFFVLIGASLLFGLAVNLNMIGPHHIWRNRLMEAFMPNKSAVNKNRWEPAREAENALMQDMCDINNPRPYHIINTNVILSNSPQVDYKGRGGDNFIISPLYCGSDATGWKRTNEFEVNKSRQGISLATAMATSAAALNPNAGVSGEGVTRNIVVSVLLSMLNLRLGYWTSNPARKNPIGTPNFFFPGLKSEIFRMGFSETDSHLLLSDGGHYENLAVYELIRRKVRCIVLSDGGADPSFNFDDLANAIEKVRVDFGTKIRFKKDYSLDEILPGTAGPSSYQQKYEIAKRGFAIADVYYPDGSMGILVYIKLAVIEGLPANVYSYKGVHPTFPHQSTSDQFFDEKQFEAYRELGYYVCSQMLDSEEGKRIFPEVG